MLRSRRIPNPNASRGPPKNSATNTNAPSIAKGTAPYGIEISDTPGSASRLPILSASSDRRFQSSGAYSDSSSARTALRTPSSVRNSGSKTVRSPPLARLRSGAGPPQYCIALDTVKQTNALGHDPHIREGPNEVFVVVGIERGFELIVRVLDQMGEVVDTGSDPSADSLLIATTLGAVHRLEPVFHTVPLCLREQCRRLVGHTRRT